MQPPPDRLADAIPSRPVWGYRFTQALHVASGIAAIPLLLAKLWTVYPRLFAWPPVRSARHALERLSVAILVAASLFELATGLLNTALWSPWSFSFVGAHYAVPCLMTGALVLHIAVKAPQIAAHWSRHSPGTPALPAEDVPDRRSLLAAVAAATGAVTVTMVGQSFTPLKGLAPLAPPHPDHGPSGLPVNRTAAAAGVGLVHAERYRLTVADPRSFTLTLDALRALPRPSSGQRLVTAHDPHRRFRPAYCVRGRGSRPAGVWRATRSRCLSRLVRRVGPGRTVGDSSSRRSGSG